MRETGLSEKLIIITTFIISEISLLGCIYATDSFLKTISYVITLLVIVGCLDWIKEFISHFSRWKNWVNLKKEIKISLVAEIMLISIFIFAGFGIYRSVEFAQPFESRIMSLTCLALGASISWISAKYYHFRSKSVLRRDVAELENRYDRVMNGLELSRIVEFDRNENGDAVGMVLRLSESPNAGIKVSDSSVKLIIK